MFIHTFIIGSLNKSFSFFCFCLFVGHDIMLIYVHCIHLFKNILQCNSYIEHTVCIVFYLKLNQIKINLCVLNVNNV